MQRTDDLSWLTSLFWSFVPYHVLRVALSSNALEEIATRGPVTPEKLSQSMGWKLRPTDRFLGTLEALRLVVRTTEGFNVSEDARRWLIKSSSSYVGGYIARLSILESAYHQLETTLKTDRPDHLLEQLTKRAFGLSDEVDHRQIMEFGAVLNATSMPIAEAFFNEITVPSNDTVLDVGAGTGVFAKALLDRGHVGSIHFLDTPSVCKTVKPTLMQYEGRIIWTPANWHDWNPQSVYDTIFIHHALHEDVFADGEELLHKCMNALRKGGTLCIIGLFRCGPSDENPLAGYFAMNLLLENGGDNTSLEWIRSVTNVGLIEESSGARSSWWQKSLGGKEGLKSYNCSIGDCRALLD